MVAGIKTGRNEAFIIDAATRDRLISQDSSSEAIIFPYIMGTDVRNWHMLRRNRYLIFAKQGIDIDEFPAVRDHLSRFRNILEPKPQSWRATSGEPNWRGRKGGSYKWYELQDTSDFFKYFAKPKVIWPDIAKLPRFVFDQSGGYLDMTCFMIPAASPYVYGVLASWATWFLISKTCQPLRLRGDRWQYRLKKQWMTCLVIPHANDDDKAKIGRIALECNKLGQRREDAIEAVRHRISETFSKGPSETLNQKAQAWTSHSIMEIGRAIKSSFKLATNPFQNPHIADQWEPYFNEKKAEVDKLSRELSDAEAELNDRVYRLFDLTSDEIKLLQREVEH